MENSAGITASLQGRYASALYELAAEQNAPVEADLIALGEALAGSSDLSALIRDPLVGREAAGRAMDGVAALMGFSTITRNFLGVLAGNGRLGKLPEIIAAFATIAAAARNEVTAQVVSAHVLSAVQLKTLTAKLAAREGQNIKINAHVDPEILGGLIVRIGSQQIDASIRTRLNSLSQAMRG